MRRERKLNQTTIISANPVIFEQGFTVPVWMYANIRSYRCYLPDCAGFPSLWTPSKMATHWCTENGNHGNQLFGNSSDGGGGGRRFWPVGINSQTSTLTDRQTNRQRMGTCWSQTGNFRLLIQPSCIRLRFNPNSSSPYSFLCLIVLFACAGREG